MNILLEVLAFVFWTILLIRLSYRDICTYRLPDSETLTLLWAGLVWNLYSHWIPLDDAVLGVVVGYLSLRIVAEIFYRVTNRVGLGGGDMKLFAAIGAWVGWQPLPIILSGAAIAALVVGVVFIKSPWREMRVKKVPFGPFLAGSGWVVFTIYFIDFL